jgi:RNA polymerase sigma-70 factor (ECF subfamily)
LITDAGPFRRDPDVHNMTDAQATPATLLNRLRGAADPSDWTRFVALYTPLLVSMARKLAVPDQEIGDLVHEVFVILFEKLPSFAYDPSRRFRGWLWTVTRNRWLTGRRHPGLHSAVPADAVAADAVADADDNPIEEEEFRRYVVRRAAELIQAEFAETTWQAFWQSVVEGRRAADVAAVLGLTVGAVWTAKCRVLKRLREEFAGLLD